METVNVSKKLLNGLNNYKIYSNAKGLASKDTQRQSPDGKTIFGTFIFSLSPTNIYNRFKRQIGNKLKWFKLTPHNVKLSHRKVEFRDEKISLIFNFSFILYAFHADFKILASV